MGVKEERERMWDSPLRSHSMNQPSIKKSLHGERTVQHLLGPNLKPTREYLLSKEDLLTRTVVTDEFSDVCLDYMIELARNRNNTPEEDLTIPGRTLNLVIDVERTYKYAKEHSAADLIIEKPVPEIAFPIREEFIRHPGLIQKANLLLAFDRMPGWKPMAQKTKVDLFSTFSRAFEINLDSCDFTLERDELVAERVVTYTYLLASLGVLADLLYRDEFPNDPAYSVVLEGVKKGLRLKRR